MTTPYNPAVIGQIIRRLRKERGLSQEVLSGFAGIARSHLAMIEPGVKSPTIETLWRLSDALGIRLSTLFLCAEELFPDPPGPHTQE